MMPSRIGRWLQRLGRRPDGRRLWVIVALPAFLVGLVLLAVGLGAARYIHALHARAAAQVRENLTSVQPAEDLEISLRELQSCLLLSLLSRHPAQLDQVPAIDRRIDAALLGARKAADTPDEQRYVGQLETNLPIYRRDYARALDHPRTTGPDRRALGRLAGEFLPSALIGPCQALRAFNEREIKIASEENLRAGTRIEQGLVLLGLCGPLAGLFLGYGAARGLSRTIYGLSVQIRDAAGKLEPAVGEVSLDGDGRPGDLNQQLQGVVGHIERVIHQLRDSQRETQRSEQLAALGRLAAGVAHELRNPLTSVKMLVQAALELPGAAAMPRADLEVIEQEIGRIEELIEVFLDFSRPPRPEPRPFDLREAVRSGVALIEVRARRQAVRTEVDLPEAAVVVHGDPVLVRQVVLNLLLNALDALPHGGTIAIRVAPEPARGRLRLEVRDDGPGIDPEVQGRLFEPFCTGKEGGLGLGLAISRRIVEEHGGTIHAENAPGGGARFTVEFPLGEPCHVLPVGRR